MPKNITVEAIVNAPVETVWKMWNEPEHVTKWCFASDDWEAPSAVCDLRVGGTFTTRMQAKDGSFGFDMGGTFTAVSELDRVEYDMWDGRHVAVTFEAIEGGTKVTETFDLEDENSEELQRNGWQSILNNFKKYAEGRP